LTVSVKTASSGVGAGTGDRVVAPAEGALSLGERSCRAAPVADSARTHTITRTKGRTVPTIVMVARWTVKCGRCSVARGGTVLAHEWVMTMTRSMTRWGGARLARRLGRSIPFLGAAIALVTVGAAIRRKGLLRGVADTALTAVPFVGTAKTAVEVVRGRDIIPDRAGRPIRRQAVRLRRN
jgi:hypothetical protein